MIRRRDIWTNPYRDHARLNGVTTGRLDWSDVRAEPNRPSSLAFALFMAGAIGFGLGVALVLLALGR